MSKDLFKSRLGFIMAGLGMAIGAGNIWRFPRVATQYGGGAFILTWSLFLFIWSLPLLIIEFGMGRKSGKGLLGAFKEFAGEKYSWMGSFVAFVSTAIMFYYCVVTGWFLRYFFYFVFNPSTQVDTAALWNGFISRQSPEHFWTTPWFFMLIGMGLTAVVAYFGISRGIERVNFFLIPSLFVLLLIAAVNVVLLPGFGKGMNFLFDFRFSQLADYNVWLNALSQSAWSTGAGWGLLLTLAVYARKSEDPVLSPAVVGFGDNTASLLAAIIIVPSIFSFNSVEQSMQIMASGNQGFAFIHLPQVFLKMPGGSVLIAIFFLALFFAAFSSMIAMMELPVRMLMDFGMSRLRAIIYVSCAGVLLGLPSALDIRVFNNQDWVWGLGLMLSGLFFVIAAIKFGLKRFREEVINPFTARPLRRGFDILVKYVIPVEFAVMLGWWIYQSINWSKGQVFSIFSEYSVGTTLFQWGAALAVLILFNKSLVRRLSR